MNVKNYLASNPESRMIYEAIVSGGPMTSAAIGRAFPDIDSHRRRSIMQHLRQYGLVERFYPERSDRYQWRAVR